MKKIRALYTTSKKHNNILIVEMKNGEIYGTRKDPIRKLTQNDLQELPNRHIRIDPMSKDLALMYGVDQDDDISVRQYSNQKGKSASWIYRQISLGRLIARKVLNNWILPADSKGFRENSWDTRYETVAAYIMNQDTQFRQKDKKLYDWYYQQKYNALHPEKNRLSREKQVRISALVQLEKQIKNKI